MAFRFNNPLRQAANQVASFNRGLGQFGEVSQALQDFNEVKRSVGRISSSIGTIGANAGGLTETITNISSAGDLVNTLTSGNNLQTTIRSVSALTRDVSTLIPGGSRIGSQAATLSKKAEDLFANAQRNAQSIKGITGGITDVLNGTLDFGQSNGPLGLGNITGALGLGELSSTVRGITGQPVIRNISSSTGAAISNILGSSPSLENIITQNVKVVPR
jgi:methyl-accepting chemotaxis protein